MRYVLVFSLFLSACGSGDGQIPLPVEEPVDLIVTGGQIIDLDTGEVVAGKAIVIRDNRIEAIVLSDSLPAAKVVFDANGSFIIPGLWDMHAHALYHELPIGTEDSAPYTWGPYMDLMLVHGVTGFRDMWGTPQAINQARNELLAGQRSGPRFVAAAMAFGWFPYMSGFEKVETAEQARTLVRQAKEEGADFIKFGLWNPGFLLEAVVDEATNLGLDVVGHAPVDMSGLDAAAAGMRSLEHSWGVLQGCTPNGESLIVKAQEAFAETQDVPFPLILHSDPLLAEFDEQKCIGQAKALARIEVWLGPTVGLWEAKAYAAEMELEANPRFALANAGDREIWKSSHGYWKKHPETNGDLAKRLYEVRLKVIKTMHDNGVPILAGSDFMNLAATPGLGLHDELRNYQLAGLTPLEALRTATVEPARYMRRTDDFGAVAAGRIADLVLLRRNPLESVENVSTVYAVVANGTLLDREALDQLLENSTSELGN